MLFSGIFKLICKHIFKMNNFDLCCLPYCNNHNFMVKLCQLEEKVCFWNKLLTYYPYPLYDTLMALPRAKLGVSLFRHPCRKPLSRERGKIRGLASQKQGRFGCLPKVISKDAYVSWTEPLHDATAQTADFAEMQNQQSKQHATPPFLTTIEVYRQSDIILW